MILKTNYFCSLCVINHILIAYYFSFGYPFLMFGFYIKKAFFDGWDNLITLVLHNFVYILTGTSHGVDLCMGVVRNGNEYNGILYLLI